MIDYLKSLKKWKKIVLLILLTLLATNPSTKEFKEHLGAVSYTHLDVYKRQFLAYSRN